MMKKRDAVLWWLLTGCATGFAQTKEAGAVLRKSFGVLRKYIGGLELATLRSDKSFLTHMQSAFAYAMHDAQSWII